MTEVVRLSQVYHPPVCTTSWIVRVRTRMATDQVGVMAAIDRSGSITIYPCAALKCWFVESQIDCKQSHKMIYGLHKRYLTKVHGLNYIWHRQRKKTRCECQFHINKLNLNMQQSICKISRTVCSERSHFQISFFRLFSPKYRDSTLEISRTVEEIFVWAIDFFQTNISR